MAADLVTQQEMIKNLTALLEANTAQLQYSSQNSDAFFMIMMAIVIYCKNILEMLRFIANKYPNL